MTFYEAIKHAEELAEKNEKQASWFWGTEGNPKYENCVERAKEHRQLAEWLKELEQLREQTRWIPCSEKLPEVHESGNLFSGIFMQSDPVLVYGICEYEENAQFHVVTYCDDLNGNTYWSTELDALTITGVIAWQPLPQPYKIESEDKE